MASQNDRNRREQCPHCNKEFNHRSLKTHKNRAHGALYPSRTVLTCPMPACGAGGFDRQATLDRHLFEAHPAYADDPKALNHTSVKRKKKDILFFEYQRDATTLNSLVERINLAQQTLQDRHVAFVAHGLDTATVWPTDKASISQRAGGETRDLLATALVSLRHARLQQGTLQNGTGGYQAVAQSLERLVVATQGPMEEAPMETFIF